jgi:hypothetical protein
MNEPLMPCGLQQFPEQSGGHTHVGIQPGGLIAWHVEEECPGEPPEAER